MCGIAGIFGNTPVGGIAKATADGGIKAGINKAKDSSIAGGLIKQQKREKAIKSAAGGSALPSPSSLIS